MGRVRRDDWLAAAVLVAMLGAGGTACITPVRHKIGVEITGDVTRGKLGIGLGWEISPTQQTITFTNNGDQDLEFCILFLDKQGREVGRFSGAVPPGGAVTTDVPFGATNLRAVSNSDCLEGKDGKDGLQRGGDPGPNPFGERSFAPEPATSPGLGSAGTWHEWRDVTLVPDLSGEGNVDSWIAVNTLRTSSARTIADFVAEHGFTLPLPILDDVREVDVQYYCESRIDPVAGTVELTFAEDQAFEEFSILVNGQPVASLAQGTAVPTANGWEARRFVLDQARFAFEATPGATWTNELEIRYRVEGQETERVARLCCEFQNAP